MKKRADIEILAPAGSFEALNAAGQAGADAVYFGLGKLNMRARSSAQFSEKDLPVILRKASEWGMQSYLTLNTVVYDQELELAKKIIGQAQEEGVDAIIASDPSVLQFAHQQGVRVHLSTQLNISNVESLKFYARYADVAVLARELNLEQVAQITETIRREGIKGPSGESIRIEMFIHGALCMAISGKCYLSLHEHKHSANRGDCFQVCRRSYTVRDKDREVELDIDQEYIMSPKDLKTIHFLNKILDAGVSILKIEGRARSAEYVKTVVSCYKEAVQAYNEGRYGPDLIADWDRRLASVFNRGFWDGYYLGQRLGEWSEVYGSQATHRKVYLGKGTNYFDRIAVAELLIENDSLERGDDILIIGPTTGVIEHRVEELRVDDQSVEKAVKGQRCSLPLKQIVRRSDKVYKLVPRS